MPDRVYPVAGVELASLACGIKRDGSPDLTLITLDEGSVAAGVFTQNAFCAAPVVVAKKHLSISSSVRALLINSGNANAGTGQEGLKNSEKTCVDMASVLGIESQSVLPFSTGVISEPLPMDKLSAGIERISAELADGNWQEAARGIMTTDTQPKLVSRRVRIGEEQITLTGMCKGAGMICPNMATMLAFVATDARLEPADLQACLNAAVRDSFNAITIDGDTSTNDACLLLATGKSGVKVGNDDSATSQQFRSALNQFFQDLAQLIVRDGEGASKFITVCVEQGRTHDECRDVAYTIAHSPLVKTAFFASDPNIGRILAAVGRSPVAELDLSTVSISLGDVEIVTAGEPSPSYSEERGQAVMDRSDITVTVKLGRGTADATVWTTDLSHEYVRINAEYRT